MKASYWRQGIATILTASLLAVGAIAQDGAEGEVNITDEAPTETAQPAEKPEAAAKPIKPQIVDRDPFVNQLMTGNVIGGEARSRGPRVRPSRAGTDAVAAADDDLGDDEFTDEVEEIEVPAPQVSVNGIAYSGTGSSAIISTANGTRMITTGQKLGDYSVARIGPKSVTFTYGGEKSFEVPLNKEFENM